MITQAVGGSQHSSIVNKGSTAIQSGLRVIQGQCYHPRILIFLGWFAVHNII